MREVGVLLPEEPYGVVGGGVVNDDGLNPHTLGGGWEAIQAGYKVVSAVPGDNAEAKLDRLRGHELPSPAFGSSASSMSMMGMPSRTG